MLGVLDGGMRFDAFVPVPLHRSRLRKKGFNQAELLARGVARRMNAPLSDTDERTLIGYTRSRAQHAGSVRALGRREAGQRHGRVLCQETSCGEDPAGRRRLHYLRDYERARP